MSHKPITVLADCRRSKPDPILLLLTCSTNSRIGLEFGCLICPSRLAIARYERIDLTVAAPVAISAGQRSAVAATLKRGDLVRGIDFLNENDLFGMQALLRSGNKWLLAKVEQAVA